MNKALTLNKTYRGITDENSLFWCHGVVGVEHQKVRKFRYPLWKYAQVSQRIVSCVCLNCNMTFYGKFAESVPLKIPVVKVDDYFATPIVVTSAGKKLSLRGQILGPWRAITQSMLTDETRTFIELIQ